MRSAGHMTQNSQIPIAKKILNGTRSLFENIYLSLLQTVEQLAVCQSAL